MANPIDRLVSAQANLRADVIDTLLRAARWPRLSGTHERAVGIPHDVDQISAPHAPNGQDWLVDEIELGSRVAGALEAENKHDRQRPITWRLLRPG